MPPLQSDSMSTFCRFLSPRSTLWRRSAETLLRLTMTVVSHAAMAPMQAMLRPKLRAQASPHSTFCHHRRLRNPLPALRMLGLREHFVKLKLSVFGLGIFTPGVSSFRKLSVECAQTDAAAVTETVPANFTQEGFEAFLVNLQSSICDEVLEGRNLLEKAAANVSIVRGRLSEARAKAVVFVCERLREAKDGLEGRRSYALVATEASVSLGAAHHSQRHQAQQCAAGRQFPCETCRFDSQESVKKVTDIQVVERAFMHGNVVALASDPKLDLIWSSLHHSDLIACKLKQLGFHLL